MKQFFFLKYLSFWNRRSIYTLDYVSVKFRTLQFTYIYIIYTYIWYIYIYTFRTSKLKPFNKVTCTLFKWQKNIELFFFAKFKNYRALKVHSMASLPTVLVTAVSENRYSLFPLQVVGIKTSKIWMHVEFIIYMWWSVELYPKIAFVIFGTALCFHEDDDLA